MKKTTCLISLGILLVLLNTACTTSGWRAPLETRGEKTSKPQPVATKPATVFGNSYLVKKGDTLYSIAWRSDNDFRTLAAWNHIRKPYTIYVGQRLRLIPPQKITKLKPKPKPQAKPPSPKPLPQTVKKPVPKPKPPAQTVKKPSPKPKPAAIPNNRALIWRWPLNGRVVATYKVGDRLRKGIKVAGALGQSVVAAESGRVVYSGSGLIGYGQLIIIKHNDKYLSAYGHNRKLLVREGQQVKQGSKIAELGRANDGRNLLHFEIRHNGKPVNPLGLLPKR